VLRTHATRGVRTAAPAIGYNRPMLWLKALHVVFVVTWFAGLFYLPRLFVYHVATDDRPGLERFVLMERRLYFIMSLGALLAVAFGIAMIAAQPGYLAQGWLRAKLLLVALLVGYHAGCYRLMLQLRAGEKRHSQRWYRLFNEVPALLLLAIVVLAVVKP
jgi:putative membrane protein